MAARFAIHAAGAINAFGCDLRVLASASPSVARVVLRDRAKATHRTFRHGRKERSGIIVFVSEADEEAVVKECVKELAETRATSNTRVVTSHERVAGDMNDRS